MTNSRPDHERPSVNQLLSQMRRTRLNGDPQQPQPPQPPQPTVHVANITAPSLPPQIRAILRLPETPAPPPRRRPRFVPRFDAQGRRLPAGPPPPSSWLSLSRHAPTIDAASAPSDDHERRLLPGLYRPGHRSLADIVLRQAVLSWEYQRSYNLYYLYTLPDRVRMALISYLTSSTDCILSLSDLKIILLPQGLEGDDDYGSPPLSPSSLNEGITHLDLSNSVGRSIKLRDLSHFLFPSESGHDEPLLESWETADAPAIPRPLLPNLTHLSLAASPETSALHSWRQLLSLSTHLPTLTHLSLAFWPVPSFTPNATYSKVVTAQGQTVQAGGMNPYSHTLDDDWSEAILVLRKLSSNLYGLEYLDLTGCSPWLKALTASADGDRVDWVGAWGKVTHMILTTGYAPPARDSAALFGKYVEFTGMAKSVERTIRSRRAGRGRFITVDRDPEPDSI